MGTTRDMRSGTLTLLCLAVGVFLAAAPDAFASSVTISGGSRLAVAGSGNERNDFLIRFDAGTDAYLVSDTVGITANGACDPVDAETATCPAAGIGSITVNAGGASDQASVDPVTVPATVEADLNGGTGNDRLFGSAAADALDGDSGTDILDGGAGADDLRGGSGADVLSYSGRTTGVTVTIGSGEDNDGGPPDVTGFRLDTVRGDIEQVIGGGGPDVMFGDTSDDILVGAGGDDRLYGLRGDDLLDGGLQSDLLSGARGADRLLGGANPDRLLGGPQGDLLAGAGGADILVGKKGPDRMNGKSGPDRINARDGGRDVKISCGSGNNRIEGARIDKRLDPRPRSC